MALGLLSALPRAGVLALLVLLLLALARPARADPFATETIFGVSKAERKRQNTLHAFQLYLEHSSLDPDEDLRLQLNHDFGPGAPRDRNGTPIAGIIGRRVSNLFWLGGR